MAEDKPLYIAFEGGEASGKSTQCRLLADHLGAVLTKEPGGTSIGSQLRAVLLDPETEDLSTMAEVYLMAADRAQHMQELVKPQLQAGINVVTDRTFISSVAYQGAGRGLGIKRVLDVNFLNPDLILPDITFVLLPPDPEERARRLGMDLDRFEQAGNGFHQRVHDCFGQMASILANDARTTDMHIASISPVNNSGCYKTPIMIHQELVARLP